MGKKDKYLVSLAKPDKKIKAMNVYGNNRVFSKDGYSFTLSDAGEAKEINKEFGKQGSGDVVVSKMPRHMTRQGIHRDTFSLSHIRNWKDRINWGE